MKSPLSILTSKNLTTVALTFSVMTLVMHPKVARAQVDIAQVEAEEAKADAERARSDALDAKKRAE